MDVRCGRGLADLVLIMHINKRQPRFHRGVFLGLHINVLYPHICIYAVSANSGILHRPCVAGQLQTNNIITVAFWLERFLLFEVLLCGEAWR
jgi:hypothetical protein